jgi:putative pyruvate formate lyase activating enzyme
VVPQIVAGLDLACRQGLDNPVVYNTSSYDSVQTLRAIARVVDVYMPDLKFLDPTLSSRYLDAPDYPEIARAALEEMYRQVGDLVLDSDGVAIRGLLVRHLVMPGASADALECVKFLASLSRSTAINVMDQYRPLGDAACFPEIRRRPVRDEVRLVREAARDAGLRLI